MLYLHGIRQKQMELVAQTKSHKQKKINHYFNSLDLHNFESRLIQ